MMQRLNESSEPLGAVGRLPESLACGLLEIPRLSRIRVIEASPQRLVFCLPGGGVLGKAILGTALIFIVLASAASVWAVGQIQQGAPATKPRPPFCSVWESS